MRYGVILPGSGGVQRGADYQLYRLLPHDVMQLGIGLGIRDYSAAGVQAAMDAFWRRVDTLVEEGASAIVLSGVPVSAGLGRARILRLFEEVPERAHVRFDATLEAIVKALGFLGARTVAIGSRFPASVNAAIADYLGAADITVAATSSRDLSLAQARQLGMEAGMRLALEVGREAMAQAPHADALVLPGGATLSLHAIPALESEFGVPVLINLSAEVWSSLLEPGLIPPVQDWGCLLANRRTV